jgi:DNA-binding HxlR family transcriptional regulator
MENNAICDKYDNHPTIMFVQLLGGKWKICILGTLLNGTTRFGELMRILHPVTRRMLVNQLRELELDGLVARKVYAQVPPKVEYSLTQLGQELRPILTLLEDWGKHYLEVTSKAVI